MFPKLSCHVYIFRQGLYEMACDLFGWQARVKGDFSVSCYISSSKSGFIFAEIINVANEENGAEAVSLDFGRCLYYLLLGILIARVTLHIIKNVHVQ